MTPNLLILGGTMEATALCNRLADLEIAATLSLAGRVERPKRQPLPLRVGGFGGAEGLADYLRASGITHVIDATHPFAAQMSLNAVQACAVTGVPLAALTRPAWQAEPGDIWQRVPDIPAAVAALDRPAMRVLLAVGRMHLAQFAPNPQHHYVLRLVDPPNGALPLPDTHIIVDRGPFSVEGDTALMQEHRIDLVVSKNAGGTGAVAKIHAARALGLPVIMIDRPALPERRELHGVDAVLGWLADHGVDLGV
ncbi:cobalt-precorrin-6A reductase [Aliishimia ponticola]|uniref:Cobalt-precorrin-6A reductase n=1 Tax=Aliishimia ponticola TaxID=2499833 RepID=A0A4S4NIZ6_9RHOB|nr:cobalt-precorrin-6A reductase [Aliishimia ponticola]THH38191.1 cobalt-precorrin-6A reductase [Aliishimia ponticola]